MKYFLTFFTLCFFTVSAWAQPVNDNCSGLIDLGLAPFCTDDLYTNVDATLTNIGFGNNPSCFNAGTAQRDVFFSFTVDPSLVDLTISVTGSALGPNGVSIISPQIALYRGSCVFDGLAELLCVSSAIGETTTHLDAIGLTPGIPYFLRINDYSATGTPNWGDFQVCVEEYIPAVNIGEEPTSAACFGTLYDSGGPDDEYGNGENSTFTVCPTDFTQCIAVDVVSFGLENGVDVLNVFAGADITAPSVASLTGTSNGNDFEILATSACVTFQFISDGSVTNEGFEVTWQCAAAACDASSFDNPTPITGFPFNMGGFTTCGQGATLNETPCTNAPFLNGPETVFTYTSEGGYCASVTVTGADEGTGLIVLSGPLGDPETICLGSAADGSIGNVNFEEPGVYYIVVANATGCTGFGLAMAEVPCALPTSLTEVLCNPLNGCVDAGIVSEFIFEDGFQDIPFNPGVNDGCWGGVGAQADYIWFTIQAAADGPFGFIVEGTNFPSDIDFNVWGPFTSEEVCETPQVVIDAATNTQPLRSSYAGGTEPTGLADVHPQLGYDIEDVYDCDGNNDDIVQTIAAQEGEVYIVLLNDWGNNIDDGAISIDWSPSDPVVVGPFETNLMVAVNDTSICAGETVLIEVVTGIDNIEWIGDNLDELSCTDCFNPTASPAESRIYKAVLVNTCYNDTIDITINVFDLDAGPDLTTCIGEEFDIPVGQDFETATYSWSPPAGLDFSCTDCPTPSVISQIAGVYEVPVSLTAEACSFMDIVTITVLDSPAPVYTIADDVTICRGETVALGGDASPDHTYEWTAEPTPDAPIPDIPNPAAVPDSTTTYYLTINNGVCPVPSLDSVTVSVTQFPVIDIVEAMPTVCRGDTIALENFIIEEDVTYSWIGNPTIFNPDSVYTQLTPQVSGSYTLVGDRLGCQAEDIFNIEVIAVRIELEQPDTTLICLGEEVVLDPLVSPSGTIIEWNQVDIMSNTPTLSPTDNTTYIATVTNGICTRMDTMYIQVDSIPMDMSIMAEPDQESYCQGELVQLISPIYEPANYPHIQHQWVGLGMETSDTLYNLVLTTTDTFTYIRTTISGACMHVDTIMLNVITPETLVITPANPEICPGESVDLLLTADALGDLEWSPAETLSCNDCPNPTATPSQTTTYTVSSDIDGCPVETSVTVAVLVPPSLNLIDDQIACAGTTIESLNLSGSQAGTTYNWTSSADPGFSSIEASISVTLEITSTYAVTASNVCGEATDEVTLTMIDIGTLNGLSVGDSIIVCRGTTFDLNADVDNSMNGVESLAWNYGDQNGLGSSVTFNAAEDGYVYFNYVYGVNLDVDICDIQSDSVWVTVQAGPIIDMEEEILACAGTEIMLNNAPVQDGVTYSWSSSTDPGFTSTDLSITIIAGATTTYTVTASTISCGEETQSVTVTGVQEPELTLTQDLTACLNSEFTVEANFDNSDFILNPNWSYNGTSMENTSASYIASLSSDMAVFNADYGFGNQICGSVTDTVNINVVDQLFTIGIETEPLGIDTSSVFGGSTFTLNALVDPPTGFDYSYTWTGNGIDMPNDPSTMVTAPNPPITNPPISPSETYTLTVTTPEGCDQSVSISIIIDPVDFKIPNVFSPNMDGKNDVFRLFTNSLPTAYNLKVFNRWGQLVFESSDPTESWDGNVNGNPAPSDVYIYQMEVTSPVIPSPQRGQVTLIR